MTKPLLATLVVLLTACATTPGSGDATKTQTAADFYPLAVGTTWRYEVDLLSARQNITVKTLRVVDGFYEDSQGMRLQVDSFGVRDPHRYLLRNPIQVGTKWSNVISASVTEHYEIIGTNQTCESPAGKWQGCVIVESRNRLEEGKTLVNELTLAPGVGIVQLNVTREENGTRSPQTSLTLLSFAPLRPPGPTSSP